VCGIAWGVVAAVVFVSMFGDPVPSPGEVGLPVGIVLVFAYLPFLVAAGVETAAGRASPALAEVVSVTVGSGAALGIVATWGFKAAQRLVRNLRSRS
jgi:hypothetical protein